MCHPVTFVGSPFGDSGGSALDVSEDCLFLNVQSPANAKNLPVLVWVHGGGYGQGSGRQDFTDLLAANNNSFVVVSIQYRLGPFGFLASDELYRKGVANAGLLDQFLSLQWVQVGQIARDRSTAFHPERTTTDYIKTYISLFGGNPSSVTISGESAGAGSVMLQGMGTMG
jgi:carboxylesterase type B